VEILTPKPLIGLDSITELFKSFTSFQVVQLLKYFFGGEVNEIKPLVDAVDLSIAESDRGGLKLTLSKNTH